MRFAYYHYAGVGDSDRLVTQERVGALVHNFNAADYDDAIRTIIKFVERSDHTRMHTLGRRTTV